MKSISKVADLAIPLIFAAMLLTFVPLRTAFELGVCEGWEVMKGFLFALGLGPSADLWNDQPVFHTLLLGFLFRLFGPSLFLARLLQVAFAALLIWSFHKLVKGTAGAFASFMAALVLIAFPPFLFQSSAVILELPAMALGLASLHFWSLATEANSRRWALLSGVSMALALQTKLTAVIFLPIILMDVVLLTFRIRNNIAPTEVNPDTGNGSRRLLNRHLDARTAIIWLVAALIPFIVMAGFSGEDFRTYMKSHFSSGTRSAYEDVSFKIESLLVMPELLFVAGLGIISIVTRRRFDLLSPLVFLATVACVHSFHRPYWDYYFIHFAIGASWLCGIGFHELFRVVSAANLSGFTRQRIFYVVAYILCIGLTTIVVWQACRRIGESLQELAGSPVVGKNAVVAELRKQAKETHWIFTDRVIYAFHAGKPVPPELAVIPEKRIWSGQITAEEMLKALERHQPEQIVLSGSFPLNQMVSEPEIQGFIEREYILTNAHTGVRFYLRKSLTNGHVPAE